MASEFIPTWLYIKQHNVTGLKYFGKTTKDPYNYKGSGQYWKRHLKEHGNDITTVWIELFSDKEQLVEFAEFFSDFNNIVSATDNAGKKIWANSVPENGLDGGQNAGFPSPLKGRPTGRDSVWKGKKRPEHSAIMKGRKQDPKHSAKISDALTGLERTDDHCKAISAAKKGVPNPKLSETLKSRKNTTTKGMKLTQYKCIHCGTMANGGNLVRWHNDNCKFKDKKDNHDQTI
jgi:hypothetical protein